MEIGNHLVFVYPDLSAYGRGLTVTLLFHHRLELLAG